MSSCDVVIGVAELGSTALSALLSSQTSIPAICTRSFSTVRSVHRRATAERLISDQRPTIASISQPCRPSHLATTHPFSRHAERLVHRSSIPRLPIALFSTSSPSQLNLKPPTTSSQPPPPANLPADHDSSSVLSVANPRLFQPPSFISDAAQHLSADQYEHLSLRLDALNAQLGTQVAVVTVRTVRVPGDSRSGGIRGWAVRLFNQWGVGRSATNDGVLVLLVEQQRRIEVVLGDGCKQHGMTDQVVQRLVDERMVPWLKRNEFGMGLVEGVSALEQLVRQSQPNKSIPAKTTLVTGQTSDNDGGIGGGTGGNGSGRGGGGGGSSGGTGWGGGGSTNVRPPFDPRVMKGLLAVVAGFIALRVLGGPSNQYSTSSGSQPSRCSRCQGKLKLAGIVDRNNLSTTSATSFNNSDLQSIDRPDTTSSSASFPSSLPSDDDPPVVVVDRNLYLPDYRVDYQHALDSLTPQQSDRLRQSGVTYHVYVCPDCSTLYLQEGDGGGGGVARPVVERMYDRTVTPPLYGTTVGGRGVGLGGGLGGLGGVSGGGGGGERRSEVVWLPTAERLVKGVRRESDFGASSSGGSGGFGGGTSSGGGGGASF